MRRLTRTALAAAATVPLMLAVAVPIAQADSPHAAVGFGTLYYEGATVRTVVTPASIPGRGVDDLYAFPDGEQLAVTSVAPGDRDYHGGRWAVHLVTWNVSAYHLTSDDAVLAAADAGDVSITRAEHADFVCPVAGSGLGAS